MANQNSVIGIAITDGDLLRISKHDAMKRAFSNLGKVWESLEYVSKRLEAAQASGFREDGKKELAQTIVDFGSVLLNGKQSDVKMEDI
ncbi:hypothetical protein J3F83DRAFT_772295 [Trichoderma novae-zelandiae]